MVVSKWHIEFIVNGAKVTGAKKYVQFSQKEINVTVAMFHCTGAGTYCVNQSCKKVNAS